MIIGMITCYTAGAGGSSAFWAEAFAVIAGGGGGIVQTAVSSGPDTTGTLVVDVQGAWNTASSSNTITTTNAVVVVEG
jgi:hypothetical protein